MNWDNVINMLNKRLSSIASHMGVDSHLYNLYASLIDQALDYDYRADGTIKIKRNKANKEPNPYQQSAFKHLMDLDTYSEKLKETKKKMDEQQQREGYTDTGYSAADLMMDEDYVRANIQKALDVVYDHQTSGGLNQFDLDLQDAVQEKPKPGYRRLADLIRRVFEHQDDEVDVFDFDLDWDQ